MKLISIYEVFLKKNFGKLHPKLQERYRITIRKDFIGKGFMNEVSGGSFVIRRLCRLGVRYNILFPERGRHIPFTIKNTCMIDKNGKMIVKWTREFIFNGKSRNFNALMYLQDGELVDLFGEPSLLVSTLSMFVDENGAMTISSKKQWLRLFGRKISLPKFLYGNAMIRESFNDEKKCFCISVEVSNPIFGTVFSYNGSFIEMEGI